MRRFVILAVFLFALAELIYEAWNYNGLYRRAVEWQLGHWGSYDPTHTLVFIGILYTGLAALLVAIAYRDSVNRADVEAFRLRLRGHTATMRSFKYLLAFTGAGIALTGWGVMETAAAKLAGARVSIDVAQLEGGASLPSRWLDISGSAELEGAVRFGEKGRDDRLETYVPLVSQPTTKPSKVAVFLYLDDGRNLEPAPHYEGVVSFRGLPGVVRALLSESGFTPADNAFVLRVGETPDRLLVGGIIYLILGGVVLAGCGAGWFISLSRRRSKRLS